MAFLCSPTVSEWLGFGRGYFLVVEYEGDRGSLKDSEYFALMAKLKTVSREGFSRGFWRVEDPKLSLDKLEKFALWLLSKDIPFVANLFSGVIHPFLNTHQEQFVPEMMVLIKKANGQISGSFGIGVLKKSFVEYTDRVILENIKKRTDPQGKFNAGKLV
jgi:hypothetical protein